MSRTAPGSAESERVVLGSVLVEPEIFGQLDRTLEPQDFYLPSHGQMASVRLWFFDFVAFSGSFRVAQNVFSQ